MMVLHYQNTPVKSPSTTLNSALPLEVSLTWHLSPNRICVNSNLLYTDAMLMFNLIFHLLYPLAKTVGHFFCLLLRTDAYHPGHN